MVTNANAAGMNGLEERKQNYLLFALSARVLIGINRRSNDND